MHNLDSNYFKTSALSPNRNDFRFKAIRDPLYGFINTSKLETKVIDTAIFRRLQSIKQLSHAYVVYPSSIHTRFEHSLGTMHVSNLMTDELGITKPDDIRRIRLSCLLHDIGHGPFSHLFESVIEKINPQFSEPHEKISRIMINEDSELDMLLDSDKHEIIKLLDKKIDSYKDPESSLQSSIISSGIDADKLDYLRRDSHHIGVAYGQFDFHRILYALTTTPHRSTICINHKGIDAIENYRLARYLMHVQVYTHHARLAADQMFIKALKIAVFDEKIIDADLLKFDPKKDNPEFLKFYTSLDDCSIYNIITGAGTASKSILEDIKKRRLLKRACEFTPQDLENTADVKNVLMKMKPDGFDQIALELSNSLNLQPHEVIFLKSTIKNKLFQEGEILLRINNDVRDLNKFSPISGKDTDKFLIYGPIDKEIRAKIASKMSSEFGIDLPKITPIQ